MKILLAILLGLLSCEVDSTELTRAEVRSYECEDGGGRVPLGSPCPAGGTCGRLEGDPSKAPICHHFCGAADQLCCYYVVGGANLLFCQPGLGCDCEHGVACECVADW